MRSKSIPGKNRKKNLRNFKKESKKKRRREIPQVKLSESIRSMIRKSLIDRYFNKNKRSTEILGCTIEEFKSYLELQFEPWMSWSNYGMAEERQKRWNIDHIIPISSGKTELEIIELNHFTNLRPLDAMENIAKSNKSII